MLDAAQPTALQLVLAAHDTPSRMSKFVPARFGLGTIVHVAPSQCSTRVPLGLDPVGCCPPTATQFELVAHDTASRSATAPAGVGAGWIDHAVPFQCSTSVW